MKNKIRWNRSMTEELIKMRHSLYFTEEFHKSRNHPMFLKKLWSELAEKLSMSGQEREIKNKYNFLLSTYRTCLATQKTSGSGNTEWIYFKLFNETYNGKVNLVPENIIECGMVEEERLDCDSTKESLHNSNLPDELICSERIKIKEKKSEKTLKIEILSKILENMEEDKKENKEKLHIKKEYLTKKSYKKDQKKFDKKLDAILNFLNKKY